MISNEHADVPTRSAFEVAVWTAVVVVSQLLLGVGIVVALVLAFTRLRTTSNTVRFGLIGLSVAILALQLLGLASGWTQFEVGSPTRVN